MKILNLTQHKATQSQINDGVIDLPENQQKVLASFLTFNELPSDFVINQSVGAALKTVRWFESEHEIVDGVMIGGALFLMIPLYLALKERGYKVLTSFTKRESVEKHLSDGSVTKTSVFNHIGFVELKNLL